MQASDRRDGHARLHRLLDPLQFVLALTPPARVAGDDLDP
jgi:hypothetical protein